MSLLHLAMGQNLWLHFGVDEHPFATYFDVHQKYRDYRALTHSHFGEQVSFARLSILWPGAKLPEMNLRARTHLNHTEGSD